MLLPGPCNLLSSGYFHCVAGLAQGGIMLWGNNPQVSLAIIFKSTSAPVVCGPLSNPNLQVLRLEAQQRKKERQAARKAEEKRLEEEEVDTTIIICLTYSPG